jgi:hypothetical protein
MAKHVGFAKDQAAKILAKLHLGNLPITCT